MGKKVNETAPFRITSYRPRGDIGVVQNLTLQVAYALLMSRTLPPAKRHVEAFAAREAALDAAGRRRRPAMEAHVDFLTATGRMEHIGDPGTWERNGWLDNTLHNPMDEVRVVRQSDAAAREDNNFRSLASSRRGIHPDAIAHENKGRKALGWGPAPGTTA